MDVIRWIKEEYNDIVGIKTYSVPLNRINGFIGLKYDLGMYPTGYTYMPFTLAIDETVTIIYAVVYWRDDKPVFSCTSPSFDSSKGEFRDSFCNYSQIEKVFKDYPKTLQTYMDMIIKKVNSKAITLNYGIYSGSDKFANKIVDGTLRPTTGAKQANSHIDTEYDLHLMGIRLLSISIFLINYRTYYNQIQLHMQKAYLTIVDNVIEYSPSLIFDKFTDSKEIYNNIFRNGTERPYGQKVIPLTVGEVVSLGNITYKPWREVVISYAVSDMVLNYICPSFALGTNWTLLEGMDETMFDNSIIKEKIESNVRVKKLITEYKKLYELSTNINDVEGYSEVLLEQISDINKNKLISNIAIAKIDENVGFTVANIPKIIRKANIVPPHYEKLVSDVSMFDKYIFDFLYASHVLHKKLGIIHIDLHLNNITIMKAYTFYKTDVNKNGIESIKYNKDKNYHVAYKMGNKTYILPFDGFYGAIIDFSDSIINKTFLEYTDRFIERQDIDYIIDKEKDEIFTKISDILKYAEKNKNKVQGSIISNYENMFKAISTIDYVTILRKIRLMFENEISLSTEGKRRGRDKRDFKVNPTIMKRLKYMEDKSLAFLLQNVQKVVTEPDVDIKWPGDVLLEEFFNGYINLSGIPKNKNIYEAWDFDAEHKYSVSTYNTYPPWLQKTALQEKFGAKEADEFIKESYISNALKTSDTHLDFILESVGVDADPTFNRLVRSRGNPTEDKKLNQ